jgi:predicted MFS family arabinose efflux permease
VTDESSLAAPDESLARRSYRYVREQLTHYLGGGARTRVILLLAAVLGLASADATTVGASATALRGSLHISNTDIGLLVSVTSLVGALATLPFGVLADRVKRTFVLGSAIVLWGAAMLWSATAGSFGNLLLSRVFLGVVTAAAGPLVASLVGDYFRPSERGKIWGFILSGELIGAGIGFSVTGNISALSWQAAFVILALPAFVLALLIFRLPEPQRGGRGVLTPSPGTHGHAEAQEEDPERETDAMRLAREAGVRPDPDQVLRRNPRRMNIFAAVRYVLAVRTNVLLIISGALGYYFLAGVQTFGSEFSTEQFRIDTPLANLLLLVVGGGAIFGVLAGGQIGDYLLKRGILSGRILVAAVTALAAVGLFAPALFKRSATGALPLLVLAVAALSAQVPPLDAARLDIMPPLLWGRAEAVRTFLRSMAQALAPLLFGAVSDHIFGGGRSGLQWTFVVMLLPLLASAYALLRAMRTYPKDVATAAASTEIMREQHFAAAD